MVSLLALADDLLRGGAERPAGGPVTLAAGRTLAVMALAGAFYGGVMGSYGGRGWQALFSAVKVPLLLLVTLALTLPGFFVLNTLLGLRADLGRALRALLAAQAGLTLVLAALAPLTALWYASSTGHQGAILFNGAMFAVATGCGHAVLRRAYQPLVAGTRRHRWLLRLWFILYAFLAMQMAWVLRPFVGTPGQPTEFFRAGSWGNAYEVLGRMIWEVVRG